MCRGMPRWVSWTTWDTGDVEHASVVEESDGTGGMSDGTRACCGGRVGGRWMDSCYAAGATECELDEGYSVQSQQQRNAGDGSVYGDVLDGERLQDAPEPLTVH